MRIFISFSMAILLVDSPILGIAQALDRSGQIYRLSTSRLVSKTSCTKTISPETMIPQRQIVSFGDGNSNNQATKGRQVQLDSQPSQNPQAVTVTTTAVQISTVHDTVTSVQMQQVTQQLTQTMTETWTAQVMVPTTRVIISPASAVCQSGDSPVLSSSSVSSFSRPAVNTATQSSNNTNASINRSGPTDSSGPTSSVTAEVPASTPTAAANDAVTVVPQKNCPCSCQCPFAAFGGMQSAQVAGPDIGTIKMTNNTSEPLQSTSFAATATGNQPENVVISQPTQCIGEGKDTASPITTGNTSSVASSALIEKAPQASSEASASQTIERTSPEPSPSDTVVPGGIMASMIENASPSFPSSVTQGDTATIPSGTSESSDSSITTATSTTSSTLPSASETAFTSTLSSTLSTSITSMSSASVISTLNTGIPTESSSDSTTLLSETSTTPSPSATDANSMSTTSSIPSSSDATQSEIQASSTSSTAIISEVTQSTSVTIDSGNLQSTLFFRLGG